MGRTKSIAALVGMLGLLVAVAACGGSGGGGKHRVYLLQNVVYPYISAGNKGVEAEAKKLGVDLTYANANGETEQQLSQVHDAIAAEAEGIIIQPNDSVAVENVIKEATDKGICTVALVVPIGPKQGQVYPGTKGYVGWNEEESGGLAADAIAEAIGGKGDVAIMIGSLTNGASKARAEGAKAEWAKKWPGIKVVSFQQEDYENDKARSEALALVSSQGENLKGLFVDTNPGADAAAKAIATTPLKGKVAIASVGGWSQYNKDIEEGNATADVPEVPVSEGEAAMKLVNECIEGNTKPVDLMETELPPVEALKPDNYTLTKKNLSEFKPEW